MNPGESLAYATALPRVLRLAEVGRNVVLDGCSEMYCDYADFQACQGTAHARKTAETALSIALVRLARQVPKKESAMGGSHFHQTLRYMPLQIAKEAGVSTILARKRILSAFLLRAILAA